MRDRIHPAGLAGLLVALAIRSHAAAKKERPWLQASRPVRPALPGGQASGGNGPSDPSGQKG